MDTFVMQGIMTALTSVSHIGEGRGTTSPLRREKIVQPDGSVEEIPIISGNSLRGILRDRGMMHMLRTLGYGVNEETGEVQGIPLNAFYLLFSGGSLGGGKNRGASRGIDVDAARRWRALVPLLGVFGGAMMNQIMPGVLKVGKIIPLCQETAHLVPHSMRETALKTSIWDLIQTEAYTRRDDAKNDHIAGLIAPMERMLLEAENQKAATKQLVEETGTKQQMRYEVETLVAGTQFMFEFTLDDPTPLEFEAFCVTLQAFSTSPYIGGKSATGHGKVSLTVDGWYSIDSRLMAQGNAVQSPIGAAYQQHLSANRTEIEKLFHELS